MRHDTVGGSSDILVRYLNITLFTQADVYVGVWHLVLITNFPETLNRFKIHYGDTILCDSLLLNIKNVRIFQCVVELHISGLTGTARNPDFFFLTRLHWQFELRLLPFTVSKTIDHSWFEFLEARTLYFTWSDSRQFQGKLVL